MNVWGDVIGGQVAKRLVKAQVPIDGNACSSAKTMKVGQMKVAKKSCSVGAQAGSLNLK